MHSLKAGQLFLPSDWLVDPNDISILDLLGLNAYVLRSSTNAVRRTIRTPQASQKGKHTAGDQRTRPAHNEEAKISGLLCERANNFSRWHIPEEPTWGEWNHFLPLRAASVADRIEVIAKFPKRGVGAARIYSN